MFGGEVGRVAVAVVDRCLRHELLDLYRVRAIDRDVGEFLILDLDILVLADSIAFDLLLVLDDLTRHTIDHLPLEAVAGGAVECVEADFLH